jgi:hypothetical protein
MGSAGSALREMLGRRFPKRHRPTWLSPGADQEISVLIRLLVVGWLTFRVAAPRLSPATTWGPSPANLVVANRPRGLTRDTESRIRWGPPQFNPQLLAKHRMVTPSETLQISQAFAAAQDAEYGHQKQVPSGNTNSSPHPSIGDRLEEADQIEIGCSRAGFGHRDGASPLSEPNAESSGQRACDTL